MGAENDGAQCPSQDKWLLKETCRQSAVGSASEWWGIAGRDRNCGDDPAVGSLPVSREAHAEPVCLSHCCSTVAVLCRLGRQRQGIQAKGCRSPRGTCSRVLKTTLTAPSWRTFQEAAQTWNRYLHRPLERSTWGSPLQSGCCFPASPWQTAQQQVAGQYRAEGHIGRAGKKAGASQAVRWNIHACPSNRAAEACCWRQCLHPRVARLHNGICNLRHGHPS